MNLVQEAGALAEMPHAEVLPKRSAASVLINGRYVPSPEDKDGRIWVRTSALVQRDRAALYALWHNVEAAPLWQEHIVAVVRTGPTTSRWSMRSGNSPDAALIHWDSETLADEPAVRIAWRSIGGDFENAGEVVFEDAVGGDRGTVVTVLQEFRVGKIAAAWETLVGRNPKQAVVENLRHFKALAETGEIPRTQTDPHGERGMSGGLKSSMYGETVPTPSGGN